MKRKKYKGDEERTILTGMIVNSRVLGKIVSGLKSEKKPFRSKWSNQIYAWCHDFFTKYNKAPRGSIRVLFSSFASTQDDEAVIELIEKYLASLSDDYRTLAKEINEDYLVDMASRYFSEIRFTRLKDQLEAGLLRHDMESVKEGLATFSPVSFATSATVEVITDEEAWKEAVEVQEDQTLVHYPGALGQFFDTHLCRDGFISFLAPEKRGKSFWLIDIAWRAAVRSKRRTFFFSVGDMSKRQMMQRFVVRATRRPLAAGDIQIPKRVVQMGSGESRVSSETLSFPHRISTKEWKQAQRKIQQLTSANSSLLKMECSANSTTTVHDIETSLNEEIKKGWVPDVVVIDYADILAPEAGARSLDFRHQTNETWKALRRMSQRFHCLVVTATQSDAASYDAKVLTKKNFSEDKRKLSHVTGMAGLNQTDEEKQKGVYRVNWILLREGIYYETRCVTVAGSLALANPAMKSVW